MCDTNQSLAYVYVYVSHRVALPLAGLHIFLQLSFHHNHQPLPPKKKLLLRIIPSFLYSPSGYSVLFQTPDSNFLLVVFPHL